MICGRWSFKLTSRVFLIRGGEESSDFIGGCACGNGMSGSCAGSCAVCCAGSGGVDKKRTKQLFG